MQGCTGAILLVLAEALRIGFHQQFLCSVTLLPRGLNSTLVQLKFVVPVHFIMVRVGTTLDQTEKQKHINHSAADTDVLHDVIDRGKLSRHTIESAVAESMNPAEGVLAACYMYQKGF
jgi:hypothetical protein